VTILRRVLEEFLDGIRLSFSFLFFILFMLSQYLVYLKYRESGS